MRLPNLLPALRSTLPLLLATLPSGAVHAAPKTSLPWIPDSTVIAHVGPRTITAFGFRDMYFVSDATLRPAQDSLGRATFFADLVDKEVLGLTALKTKHEFTFEDRVNFNNFRNTTLSNMLYQHEVSYNDSIPEDSLKRVLGFYSRDIKLKLLYFPTREQADMVRLQLIGGRLTWTAALGKYAVQSPTIANGVTLNWLRFDALPIEVALPIWCLRVGQVSPVITAASGYHVVLVFEERQRAPLPYVAMRRTIENALHNVVQLQRRIAIQAKAKQGMDVVYDSTNVRWTSGYFRQSKQVTTEGLGAAVSLDESVPEFSTQDTARTLVRWKGGRLSVGDIVHEYADMQVMMRPSLNTPERVFDFIDAIMLAPKMIGLAEALGLDKDPQVATLIEKKREEILVTHMVEDSVLSRISVTKAERRAYYDANVRDFMSYPSVRYALLPRLTREAADSTKRALDNGANIDTVLARDQAAGISSVIKQVRSNEPADFHKILFEELRPGQNTVVGPDPEKHYGVIHEYTYDPGHLIPFEEMEGVIDESVRNIKGDRAMQDFLERHRADYLIETHPELLMRIHLVDPTLDVR